MGKYGQAPPPPPPPKIRLVKEGVDVTEGEGSDE